MTAPGQEVGPLSFLSPHSVEQRIVKLSYFLRIIILTFGKGDSLAKIETFLVDGCGMRCYDTHNLSMIFGKDSTRCSLSLLEC